ncbi:hypothetical protein IFM89_037908 [Coptis chinensis]|uniref:Uncharacterized protein n=1 Tax=Coptis chinensis TaxID=261450 RepID=A0A835IIF7_9MAGN|nr:hypothetical protein IFM89_037908 [Coptis chinensis]
MKEATKLLVVASLVMVVSLGVVLALLLVLLAQLYCSLLLRKRSLQDAAPINTNTTSTTSTDALQGQQDTSTPFSSIYAQGVLRAPRSLLFPTIISKEEKDDMHKQQKQHPKLDNVHEITIEEPNSSTHCIGIVSASSPSTSYLPVFSHQPIQEVTIEGQASRKSGSDGEHLVYISNPIYDNEMCRPIRVDTPFETPDTSPSRLGRSGSSSEDDDNCKPSPSSPSSLPMTPPLTPMKKLPAQACSVSLGDARSLGTSGSGSDSNNGLSSSTSGSPRTSPSW